MDFNLTTKQQQIRGKIKKVCREFSDAYWRDLDSKKAYRKAFVSHLLGLGIVVASLVAACVLAAVLAGCASPTARDPRDAIAAEYSPTEQSAAATPRFAAGGPDAENYGASEGYPIGERGACQRIIFLIGCQSHFDQVYEGRLVRRAPTPSPLARAGSEPAVRYEYQGQTFSLDDYLARNPTTGLLVAQGDTILVERYQYARHDRHRFTSHSMAKTVTARPICIAIGKGHIRSVADPGVPTCPRLPIPSKGAPYGGICFRCPHVCVRRGVQGKRRRVAPRCLHVSQIGSGGVEAVTPFNGRVAPSGTRFYYALVKTEVLGLVLRNAVGRPTADYLQEKIWEPMGAEADATWLIDRAGEEATYRCFNAALRTMHVLDCPCPEWKLAWGQIIPAAWIEDATRLRPDEPNLHLPTMTRSSAYGYQVWSSRENGGCFCSWHPRPGDLRRSGEPARDGPHGGPETVRAIQASEKRTRSGEAWSNNSEH